MFEIKNDSYENYEEIKMIGNDKYVELHLVCRKSSNKWFILKIVDLNLVSEFFI